MYERFTTTRSQCCPRARARLQVQRALLLGHAAAKEVDAGHGRRHGAQHCAHRVARHVRRRRRRHIQACARRAHSHDGVLRMHMQNMFMSCHMVCQECEAQSVQMPCQRQGQDPS